MKKIFTSLLAILFSATHICATSGETEEEPVYVVVESMPEFPGGQQALFKFISENMDYPIIAWENGIEGRAICQFVVNKDGSIGDVEIVRSGGDPSLDKEAIRIIESMPQWKPGKQRGLNVRVKYTLPVNFRMSGLSVRPTHKHTDNTEKTTPIQPPLLAFIDGSLSFKDFSQNNRIEVGEQCSVEFKIKNEGKGAAENCEARVKLSGAATGIKVQTIKLPSIAVGQTYQVNIPISADINTQDGKVTFSIEVYEPQGWGIAPFDLTVATKAYEQPLLQVVDYNVASKSGKIKKMEAFSVTFNLQNTKYGDAENVKVKVILPTYILVMDGSTEMSFPLLKSGEVKNISLTLAANNNYPSTTIPIIIDVKERYGRFAENKQVDIALNQATSSSINIAAKDEPQQERKEIQLAMMTAEVDRNIPVTKIKNNNTFVLIIANEHYQRVALVPFAVNDGNIFREYCLKTLGIGEKRIHYLPDATYMQIKDEVRWLKNITETFDDANIIVYYAGHGIPDEASKTAYLLPVDGSGTDVSTGYKLDDLYTDLGKMPASRITVFMDACFSGSKREEGMLASARGVALKVKAGEPQGNMVVFSAAQGNETAYPNKEKQHGLFTYYLLKKLQDTQGDVTLQELGDYIITNVKQQSLLVNNKKQTPCITPSATVSTDWQNWKLK